MPCLSFLSPPIHLKTFTSMKKPLHLWILICLTCILLSNYSCQSDTLPDPTGPEQPEVPADSPDAYHDKMRTQPYPKADNEVYLNPTPFIVPQNMKKQGAQLQFSISRSADFSSAETILSEPKAWNFFNPHKRLETGTWYWRFRSVSTDGTPQDWSQTYQFEMRDDAPRFVTPAFEAFFNNAPRRHPRLYCFLDDRIEQARQKAATHPEYRQLRSRANLALNTDYANLTDPYANPEELKNHVNYLYQAHYITLQRIYSDKLHEILRALLAHPVSDKVLFSSNFTSTNIAISFIEIYDLLYQELSADEKSAIEELLMRVSTRYFKIHCGMQENHIFDNHFWQQNMRILFQAAFMLYDKSNYSAQTMQMLEYYYELWTARAPASGFNRDGVWHNGAGYFNANVKTLYYMPALFSHIARKDFLLHPWYQHAGRSLVYTWPPESKSNGFGDGSERGDEPNRLRVAFADFLARETGDAYAGWYAERCNTLLQQDYELRLYRMAANRSYSTQLPIEAPKLVWYRDAGEVAMHSDLADTQNDLALSFRSSTFGSGSHTVSNQNAFNLLYRGADVYRSSGYYLNFSDAHNLMSYRHTRAHNTLLVNGIGQPYSTQGYGYIARALGGEHISYCLGDASKAYSGISTDTLWTNAFARAGITQTPENGFGATPLTLYRRHVLMLHPNTIVLYDELEAREPVRWDWLLHSPTEFHIDASQQMVTTADTDRGFISVAQIFSDHACEITQTDRFVVPPTTVPDPQYPNQWHLSATFNGAERNRILTVIQVVPSDSRPHIIRRNGSTFTLGDWTVEAELNASQPPALTVSSRVHPAVFSYGADNPLLEGEVYPRQQPHSSLLYDVQDGQYIVTEQTDHRPASTRTSQ